MKKKTSFKLFKISSIICIVLTLISFASLSASAETQSVYDLDPRTMDVFYTSNMTRTSMATPTGIPYARFSSSSGNTGLGFYQKLSDGNFIVGNKYVIDFKFRTGSNKTIFNCFLSSVPADDPDFSSQTVLFELDSSKYSSGEFHSYNTSFVLPQSYNGAEIYIVFQLSAVSGATNFDLTKLNFSLWTEIPQDWEAPSYSLEEPDLAEQIEHFNDNEDTFFEVDWFRESNPVGNGAKAFLGLFTSVWTQFDRAPWLKLMVTFSILTSLIGLIVNSAAHIVFDKSVERDMSDFYFKRDYERRGRRLTRQLRSDVKHTDL